MAGSVLAIEVLPADWASALINNDWSGLEFHDPEFAKEAKEWEKNSGLEALYCDSEAYTGNYKGQTTLVCDFVCVSKQ